MSEREIVRKENIPVMFSKDIVQFVRCGKSCNPQKYKPSAQRNKFCRRHKARKRCDD